MRAGNRRGLRLRRAAWAVAALLSLSACNQVSFYRRGPSLRGITIPLPPPSFHDEQIVEIDVDGSVPSDAGRGTQVFLYDYGVQDGYFEYAAENGSFLFEDVPVDLQDNCLELYYVTPDDEESGSTFYRAVLRNGPEECTELNQCSEQDAEGACVCLEKWNSGC